MSLPIITIDGDSGAGKGTLAHALAQHFGFHYLDSGAIYRMVAYAAKKYGWLELAEDDLNQHVRGLQLSFKPSACLTAYQAYCNDEEVTARIRETDIAAIASELSSRQSLRSILLNVQRDFAKLPGLVTDGRDMGTIIFPEAPIKFYLTADANIRAKRRHKQLKDSDNNVSLADVEKKLNQRDNRDKTRSAAPLVAAEDAHVIDSTLLSAQQVFEQACQFINDKGFSSAN